MARVGIEWGEKLILWLISTVKRSPTVNLIFDISSVFPRVELIRLSKDIIGLPLFQDIIMENIFLLQLCFTFLFKIVYSN